MSKVNLSGNRYNQHYLCMCLNWRFSHELSYAANWCWAQRKVPYLHKKKRMNRGRIKINSWHALKDISTRIFTSHRTFGTTTTTLFTDSTWLWNLNGSIISSFLQFFCFFNFIVCLYFVSFVINAKTKVPKH